MYLAGYAVECMLKSLLLSNVSGRARAQLMKEMRGARAHDFAWLKAEYLRVGGAAFPRGVHRHFVLVNSWNTNLRYASGTQRKDVTQAFLNAADSVIQWADERL